MAHATCVFLCLASIIKHNIFEIHLWSSMQQYFNLSAGVLCPILFYLPRKFDLSAPSYIFSLSFYLTWPINMFNCLKFEKQNKKNPTISISYNVKMKFTIRPSNSIPRYLSKRNGNICPHKTCIWMFIAILHRIPKGGNDPNVIQTVNSFKQDMIYKLNGI